MTEEGGEVGLGHDAANLLHKELYLVLVLRHGWTAIGRELHHGEERAEQVALGIAIVSLHQLVGGGCTQDKGEMMLKDSYSWSHGVPTALAGSPWTARCKST